MKSRQEQEKKKGGRGPEIILAVLQRLLEQEQEQGKEEIKVTGTGGR